MPRGTSRIVALSSEKFRTRRSLLLCSHALRSFSCCSVVQYATSTSHALNKTTTRQKQGTLLPVRVAFYDNGGVGRVMSCSHRVQLYVPFLTDSFYHAAGFARGQHRHAEIPLHYIAAAGPKSADGGKTRPQSTTKTRRCTLLPKGTQSRNFVRACYSPFRHNRHCFH